MVDRFRLTELWHWIGYIKQVLNKQNYLKDMLRNETKSIYRFKPHWVWSQPASIEQGQKV